MNKEIIRRDRAVTDINQIIKIVDNAKILHLGLIDQGFPYIVPLHYGYEYDESNDKFSFYMHGAKEGHKIDLINANSNAFIELETDIDLDLAGENPCQYGSFYSSVMGQGQASIVENTDEKKHALNLLMLNQVGRKFEFTDNMVNGVVVIKVAVRNYTAKARMKAQR